MENNRILVVDDDPSVRRIICRVLGSEGISTEEADGGVDAVRMAVSNPYSLIILDLMMDDMDGFQVIHHLRTNGILTPLFVLSGRQAEVDKVLALGIGADDYITKPFNPVVLGAKIKALIRRNKKAAYNAHNFITAGPFRYSNMTLEFFKNEQLIPLSSKENVMMKLFISNVGRVFTKEQLYELVWGNSIVDENAIMVYISHLRNKIEDNPKSPRYIKTVWGLGYKFTVNEGE